MEFKGTKGRLIYKPTQKTNGKVDKFRVFKEDKQGFYDSGLCLIENDNDESEYNALLFTKAPEMLEEIKRLVKALKIVSPYRVTGSVIDHAEKLIKEATEL
ncbi:hypothetical protein [Chryseobacterium sp. JK1]|uniref:hypothetical protein n=1 Tax=Chryseobacterium sp. JK1 TaxID=874294 RepID=UPI003D6937B1